MQFRRTHTCGALRKENAGQHVLLAGWVNRRRDHGGLIFIDLRDRFGITQLVFDPHVNATAHNAAEALRNEWVIAAEGKVLLRAPGMENSKLPTGAIEVEVSALNVLSKAQTPPFSVCDETIDVNEELRLVYRYLDMRRGDILQKLLVRHKAMLAARNFLSEKGFTEVTTPILGKSTPEGARDYLVPSRIHPGKFYALPQSPQIFKQLLMVGGLDRYFQIAPCFRDEDLRADRQPEFHQIDIEMSFGTIEDLFPVIEKLCAHIFTTCLGIQIPQTFQRLTYAECIDRYGSDKPDLRFGMELHHLEKILHDTDFEVFTQQILRGGAIKGFCIKDGANLLSRREIDAYTTFVGHFGVKGLVWTKLQDGAFSGGIAKYLSTGQQKKLIEKMRVENGDLIFMIAEGAALTNQALDHLRRKIAKDLNLIHPHRYEFLWVTDYPLFHFNHTEQRMESEHHPFTSPHLEDIPLLDTAPLKMRSSSYDLVLNGYEVASGSQRIHDSELQEKIFAALQLTPEEIKEKFGFFVDALKYGTPPHLGIALGFDRIVMILTQTENIRDVVAFPKTQKATDLMMEAPAPVQKKQLDELHIDTKEPRA